MTFRELRKRALVELGFRPELVEVLVDFTSPRERERLPEPELLKQFPAESAPAYERRLEREWRRETRGPRRRQSAEDERRELDEIIAVLGV